MRDEPRNPDLERVIAEDPDDDAGFSVYADWLASLDHPRGRFAAYLARGLVTEANALLAAHPGLWGEMAEFRDLVEEVAWRGGFIDAAKLTTYYRDYPLPPVQLDDVLAQLLRGVGRFLRGLTVGIVEFEGNTYAPITRRLAALGPLPALRSLFYGDFEPSEAELSWSTIGALEPLYAAVPRLQTLKLRSGSMDLGTIVLPELRRMTIVTGGLTAANARSIAGATWPKLERLDVMFGNQLSLVAPIGDLLDGVGVPALRVLGLQNTNLRRALAPALVEAAVVQQLRVLDVSLGTLDDRDAEILAARGERFRHLDEIVVRGNYFTRAGLRALATIGPKIVTTGPDLSNVRWELDELGQRRGDDRRAAIE